MLVCTLCGDNVFHNFSNIGTISTINELPKVFKYCKEHFNINFDNLNMSNVIGTYVYHLEDSDTRDITLIISNVYSL